MEHVQYFLNQGVAVALLVFGCYAAWRGVSWFGTTILKPYATKQVEFLEKLEDTLREVKDTVIAIREELRSGRK